MSRSVLLSAPAQKTYDSLPQETRQRVRETLLAFANSGRGDLKLLRGTRGRDDLFRLRVGAYRVVFAQSPTEIRVTRIIHRREGYDWL
ncbi:MAG: type II toxin-antitoxin system RelE/ParE family toxin [Thermoplasmata archaeon]|nr:type II toxin-antitoxin system RelE/ParE family toxin [Thermoplasmata archaeon]